MKQQANTEINWQGTPCIQGKSKDTLLCLSSARKARYQASTNVLGMVKSSIGGSRCERRVHVPVSCRVVETGGMQ